LSTHKERWGYNGDNRSLSLIRNFYGQTSQTRRIVSKSGKHPHTIGELHCFGMCSSKITDFVTDVVWEILIRSREVKVISRHENKLQRNLSLTSNKGPVVTREQLLLLLMLMFGI